MNNEDQTKAIDKVLNLLTKPLNRYILSVLAGVEPGVFAETDENHTTNPTRNRIDCKSDQ